MSETPGNSATKPIRRRLSGDERRSSILGAACVEFARIGYHGTSTASIARAAGCSEPMLYKHFASKQELFCAALEDSFATFARSHQQLVSYEGDVIEQVSSYVTDIMADPNYLQMLQLRHMAICLMHEPAVRSMLEATDTQTYVRITQTLETARAAGIVRADLTADYVAAAWIGFMLAACYREALIPGGFRASRSHVLEFLDNLRV
jgi:AcrR family transcriptional regulator